VSVGADITVRPLGTDDWPLIERLFGANGACGGCWCMVWRLPKGGALWTESKGEPNRKAFKRLVVSGRASGVLAFRGETAVGWCSAAPKEDFAYFGRTRALDIDSPPKTWSVTCFFVPSRARGQGVAGALLRGAIELARKGGAAALEGYPVRPPASGEKTAAAFAWTGVPALFTAAVQRRRKVSR
jgi:predicted GNAT family acetyltransferase